MDLSYLKHNGRYKSVPLQMIADELQIAEQEDWSELDYLDVDVDREIQVGFFSYVKVGYFLDKMRYYKLYQKQGFNSFKEYCLKVLRKSAHYCIKIISAAEVCLRLAALGFEQLPNCVAQALPLVKFNPVFGLDSPLYDKWQDVLDNTPPGQPITAKHIAEILDETPPETKPQQVKVKADTYAKLEKIAEAKDLTVQEVIDELADYVLGEIEAEPTPVPPEKQAAWKADSEALVKEHEQAEINWEISDSNGTSYHTSYIPIPRPGFMPDSS
ncbi:hypothetical protein [Kamptonema formosum]|uniref:hypothetical protein n=1 Tax=Kamptonema formosum TaxID=331992 RepID=UPI000349CAB0|nr:hypothetical protein [Kamptonema formosum]